MSLLTEAAATGASTDMSLQMGEGVIGLQMGGMFPRMAAVATGPSRDTSALMGEGAIGCRAEDTSPLTGAAATGDRVTRRDAAAACPSSESKWGKTNS